MPLRLIKIQRHTLPCANLPLLTPVESSDLNIHHSYMQALCSRILVWRCQCLHFFINWCVLDWQLDSEPRCTYSELSGLGTSWYHIFEEVNANLYWACGKIRKGEQRRNLCSLRSQSLLQTHTHTKVHTITLCRVCGFYFSEIYLKLLFNLLDCGSNRLFSMSLWMPPAEDLCICGQWVISAANGTFGPNTGWERRGVCTVKKKTAEYKEEMMRKKPRNLLNEQDPHEGHWCHMW
jgi:hypothetical protein